MDAFKKLLLLAGAALLALTLFAGPALGAEAEDTGEEVQTEETDTEAAEEESGGKIQIAETPRQQVGLILLGFLVVAGGLSLLNARRQLKGERPAASGEFRWR